MLKKPDLSDAQIISCLRNEYGLTIIQVTFLPLGADPHSVVYKVVADDNKSYFLKMRSGNFDETSVVIPKLLKDQGIEHVIVSLETKAHMLWPRLENFHVILYPFVHGKDATKIPLSDKQWMDFGSTLGQIHRFKIHDNLRNQLQLETYSPKYREMVKALLARLEKESFAEL